MRELEVRCCCAPERLLGYMQVADDQVRRGARILGRRVANVAVPFITYEMLELSVEEIEIPGAPRDLAVKAEGHDARSISEFFGSAFRPAFTPGSNL